LRSIKDIEVFVIFTETGRNKTRVNLRSSSTFDVSKIANSFGGGGHRRASGCAVDMNILRSRKEVLKRIRKAL
jgi:phosphoesterase RecJ-like protein